MHAKTRDAGAALSPARGFAWLCTRGYMQHRQGLCKPVVAGADHGNLALWVELAKMLYVPGVAHWQAFFDLEADSAGPRDLSHPIRTFPLWRQLVGILGRLSAPKNTLALYETPALVLAAMVATQGLLVSSSSYRSLETSFLKEQRVIL